MSKSVYLFICSSGEFSKSENVSHLQYAGRVLNLAREGLKKEDVINFTGDFIVVNACNENEMKFLRLINLDNCLKVCVLRKSESSQSEWVKQQNFNYDYIIKQNQIGSLQDAKNKEEILNYLRYLDMSKKKPESDLKFLFSKIKSILPFIGMIFRKYS